MPSRNATMPTKSRRPKSTRTASPNQGVKKKAPADNRAEHKNPMRQSAGAKLKTTELPDSYKGVKELVFVDPASLNDNPLNWKTHPQNQLRGLTAAIKDVGWAGTLLFNEITGRLIDGHGRKKRAINDGETVVPVLVGSWTEDEERRILATLDPLGGMYRTDEKALKSLTAGMKSDVKLIRNLKREDKAALLDLTEQLEDFAKQIEEGSQSRTLLPQRRQRHSNEDDGDSDFDHDESTEYVEDEDLDTDESRAYDGNLKEDSTLKEDVIFESSNSWGIPNIRSDMLVTPDKLPTEVWDRSMKTTHELSVYCHSARPFKATNMQQVAEKPSGGFLSFYTNDWRFEQAYVDSGDFTEVLLEEDWHGVFEPDFSCMSIWPLVMGMWGVYRSRWCARYWQEAGIPIIPIIRCYKEPVKNSTWLYQTLPECPVVGLSIRNLFYPEKKAFSEYTVKSIVEGFKHTKPEVAIIYGSLDCRKYIDNQLPKGVKYIWLDSYINARRKANPSMRKKR